MKYSNKSGLWCEDNRPRHVEDLILPKATKLQFSNFIVAGELTSLIFTGSPGTGKTSAARALCNDLGCDSITINCSEDSGIDVLRTRIRDFASTVSLMSDAAHKVVIMDEADYLGHTVQPALRGFIEEFQSNVRFIFTCNYINKIIPALHSRCSVVSFDIPKSERPMLSLKFYKRIISILEDDNIPFDTKVLVKFVNHHFPDMRRTLNELQRYSMSGEIDTGILTSIDNSNFLNLIALLKDKNFKEMRNWVAVNSDDPVSVYNKLYETAYDHIQPATIPALVVIIAEYSYKNSFCANNEINLAACLVELMSEVHFV